MIRLLASFVAVTVVFTIVTNSWSKVLIGFGGDGGSEHELDCGLNAALVGLDARYGDFMDAIAAVCRRVAPNGRLGEEYTIGPAGGGGGQPHRQTCPSSSVVAGMSGGFGRFINSITLVCRNWDVQRKAPTSVDRTKLDFSGLQPAPSRQNLVTCDPGTFASGFYVRSGVFVDHVNLVCDSYQP